jgi:hypothetical protein
MSASRKSLRIWLQVAAAVVLCLGAFNTQASWLSASPEPGITTGEPQKPKIPKIGPDLIVQSISKHFIKETESEVVGHRVKSTEYRVQVRLRNIGKLKAGPFRVLVKMRLHYPNGSSGSYQQAAVLKCKGLNINEMIDLSLPKTYLDHEGSSPTAETMWWCFKATADSKNEVQETNEANNILIQTNCKQY